MANTSMNTNKKESKLYAFFKDDNPKTLMILNGITAAIWVFVTAMNLYSLNTYAHVNSFNTYFTGGLALFYIGMTLGYAIKYRKVKIAERGESNEHIA
ncbi:MAG: hypothetical protein K6E27_00925 [Eubacterium sp.]|nr:hypothetical protein [Eubacterium sp.]